jgi:hypothetical protein
LQVGILAAPGAQGTGNFYYYDMPVAINGKQMNYPSNSGYAGQSTIHARAIIVAAIVAIANYKERCFHGRLAFCK